MLTMDNRAIQGHFIKRNAQYSYNKNVTSTICAYGVSEYAHDINPIVK